MNKEGWLKVGVVGVPICAYIMLVHLPTTSPYGYSTPSGSPRYRGRAIPKRRRIEILRLLCRKVLVACNCLSLSLVTIII